MLSFNTQAGTFKGVLKPFLVGSTVKLCLFALRLIGGYLNSKVHSVPAEIARFLTNSMSYDLPLFLGSFGGIYKVSTKTYESQSTDEWTNDAMTCSFSSSLAYCGSHMGAMTRDWRYLRDSWRVSRWPLVPASRPQSTFCGKRSR